MLLLRLMVCHPTACVMGQHPVADDQSFKIYVSSRTVSIGVFCVNHIAYPPQITCIGIKCCVVKSTVKIVN